MIDKKYEIDLKEIADKLGYEEQSMQLIEEMAELTQAINKYRRYGGYYKMLNVIEELADVSIVLYQLEHLLHVDKLVINTHIEHKIKRTKKRIAESGKNVEV